MSPFEEEINNFDNFETSDLPDKLRDEIEKTPSPPRSPPKTVPPPPLPIYQNPPQNNTYVGTHFSYQEKPSTTITTATNPPPKVEFKSYIPPPQPKVVESSLPPVRVSTGSSVRASTGGTSVAPGVGFSYQASQNTTQTTYVNPPPPQNRVTVQPVHVSTSVVAPPPPQVRSQMPPTVIQSSVPYTSTAV